MKKSSLFALFAPLLVGASLLSSCGNSVENSKTPLLRAGGDVTIRILHQEDYMDESLIDVFEKENPGVKVVLEKSETNETVYSELRTGKAQYNLVTVSEYMVQRMANEGLIQRINLGPDSIYEKNLSTYLRGKIDGIKVHDKVNDIDVPLSEFGKGYMWGTLGTIVNPYFKDYKAKGLTKDEIVYDDLRGTDGWSAFWDSKYKGSQSIKDSMRDSYALGIFQIFKDEFLRPTSDFEATSEKTAKEVEFEYKNKTLFNDHHPDTIDKVKDALIDLKSNIFGFEVDSGKNDIITGKIGMNLAWSGDAAYSILGGEYYDLDEDEPKEKPESKKTLLYYNIPEIGSNIWFDAFCMPATTDPNSKEYEYTCKFIDFISRPDSVVANMSYTGFTSFMSGEGVKVASDLVNEEEAANDPTVNQIAKFVRETFDYFTINDVPEAEKAQTIIDEKLIPYDISYFFNLTDEEIAAGENMIMYVNPDSFEGRQIVAQYPQLSDIDHLYVMEDYGKDNPKIVQMWEEIKVNPLPTWVIVGLILFFVIVLGYLGTYQIVKRYKIKKRKQLRNSK